MTQTPLTMQRRERDIVAPESNPPTPIAMFASSGLLRDNQRPMAARPNVLFLISEFIVMLLGGFLILLSVSRTVAVPSKLVMIILGAIVVYWALRAWMRKEPAAERLQTHVRAGSLAILGLIMVTIALVPLSFANLLVTLAGCVLVVRGLIAALLAFRRT
ncbi:MAG TPA: hypothetical protein VJS43_13825 [Candidatus Acidoferrales bacterium]|nr:hypothetical protein [Candidatus Acidoferrales bacterium]